MGFNSGFKGLIKFFQGPKNTITKAVR